MDDQVRARFFRLDGEVCQVGEISAAIRVCATPARLVDLLRLLLLSRDLSDQT